MKIAIYSPTYPEVNGAGGIGTYTRHLATALVAGGHEIHVLTRGSAGRTKDRGVSVECVSAAHVPLADRVLPGFGACARLAGAISRLSSARHADVVELPNWEGLGVGFQMFRRTPTVVRFHTSTLECQEIDAAPSTRATRWDVRRERWQASLATVLVTHSRAHRQRMAAELDIPPDKIALVPHGIPVFPEFRRVQRVSAEPTVVYLGRLERRKGTLDLLRAIPQVLRDVPSARFVLIGADRPHCPGGRTHAQYLKDEFPPTVQARVTLAGQLPSAEVDRWLQTADVFVAPSLYESFGLIFLEAMRWGTPVVGTTAGGIPEIVEDGRSGLLVPPGDSGQLSHAIVRLLGNAQLRQELGVAGRARCEQMFNVEIMAARMAELYRGAVEGRSVV